jgi:hypothetical protein
VLSPAPDELPGADLDPDLLAATDWPAPNRTELATLTGLATNSMGGAPGWRQGLTLAGSRRDQVGALWRRQRV